MYYMLNLVFNYNDSTAGYGRFVDYDATQTNPLLTSKAWLQPSSTAPDPPDPNNSAHWVFSQKDAQKLRFANSVQPNLWVRVLDANQSSDNYNSRITILIARKGNAQPMSSPIVNSSVVSGPLSIWDTVPSSGVQATNGSWVTVLGQATQGSGSNGTQNKYSMVVAATVNGSPRRTLSHDPDFEVDM